MLDGYPQLPDTALEVPNMNPPIDRQNLRDVLIALAVAGGLAWIVAVVEGCAPKAQLHTPASTQLVMLRTAR
jgi:hypothetical protein